MALNRKVVEGWRYPDARPELDAIREDVLALMDGNQPEVEALKSREGQLLKELAAKDSEISEARNAARSAEERAALVEGNLADIQEAAQELTAERDALAGRVLELEEAQVAAEEAEEQPS